MELDFVCSLRPGLHARPASVLARVANGFAADCRLVNRRGGATADMKSILALIAADVRHDDECRIEVSGADEQQAHAALRRCLEDELPRAETDSEPRPPSSISLPEELRAAHIAVHTGVTLCPGIGVGRVVAIRACALPSPEVPIGEREGSQRARERLEHALSSVGATLAEQAAAATRPSESGVLSAHLQIVNDRALRQRLYVGVAEGRSAAQATIEAGRFFSGQLQGSSSHYVRERAVDVVDVCVRLLEALGVAAVAQTAVLTEPSVVIAETLSPRQLLTLNRRWLQALVLESVSRTSHVAILARSFGIPTLIGVGDAVRGLASLDRILVDAGRGFACAISPAVQRFYEREMRLQTLRDAYRRENAAADAISLDGCKLAVAANIASAEEAEAARTCGADGVGLFRSEMLFAASNVSLGEEAQFEAYVAAARAMQAGVIIRTLDVGADKPLPSVPMPPEDNPFLGRRGVRVYRDQRELFRTQLRAILRASAFGAVQMLLPMISSLEEVLWVKHELAEVREGLERRGIAFDRALKLGAMLEVPAACFIIDELCAELDFFSIGSNDLSQYFCAADRNNTRVAALADPLHPGFLRLLQNTVQQIRAAGKWVGICGEMAAELDHLPLMLGLGMDEISVATAAIPALKGRVRMLSVAHSRALLAGALRCRSAAEVRALLGADSARARGPLLDEALVILQAQDAAKAEALRTLSERLFVCSRASDAGRLEEALWAREAQYSTGLGNGFAVPHCKDDAVTVDSIAVLKPRQPIEWDAADEQPVHFIILLAMRDSSSGERHMEVFSKLARKLMDADFRTRLLELASPTDMVKVLHEELGLTS